MFDTSQQNFLHNQTNPMSSGQSQLHPCQPNLSQDHGHDSHKQQSSSEQHNYLQSGTAQLHQQQGMGQLSTGPPGSSYSNSGPSNHGTDITTLPTTLQGGTTYNMSNIGDTLEQRRTSIFKEEISGSSNANRDIWIAPNGADDLQQQKGLASGSSWQTFSIQVFRGSSKIKEYKKFSHIDPSCFQFVLLERFQDVQKNYLSKFEGVEFEVKEECLFAYVSKEIDDETLDENLVNFKDDFCRDITQYFKCEKVSIPDRFQEFVIQHKQKIKELQSRMVILLHCQDVEYKVVGCTTKVSEVAATIQHLVGRAGEVETPTQRLEEQMDINEKTPVPSEISEETLKIKLSKDDIRIVNELMALNNIRIVADGIEIHGRKSYVEGVEKDIQSQLKQVQMSHDSVDEMIWTFLFNQTEGINIQLQKNGVQCIWSLPGNCSIEVKALTKKEAEKGMSIIKSSVKMASLSKVTFLNSAMQQFINDNVNKMEIKSWGEGVRIFMFPELQSHFIKTKLEIEVYEPNVNPNEVANTQAKILEKEQKETLTNANPKSQIDSKETFVNPPSSPEVPRKTDSYDVKSLEHRQIKMSNQERIYFEKFSKSGFQKFAEKNNTKLCIESNEIVLSGTRDGINTVFKEVSETLCKLESITELVFCAGPSLGGKKNFLQDNHECLISIKEQTSNILYAWLSRNVINVITVNKAPIELAEVDVIICPVTEDLLPFGVGSDIFSAGDPKKLQAYSACCKKSPGKSNGGYIGVIQSSGKLKCQYVGLSIWPLSSDVKNIDVKVVQKLAENLISVVMDTGCRTIALPLYVSESCLNHEIATMILDKFLTCVKNNISHHVQIHFYSSIYEQCLEFKDNVDRQVAKAFPVDFAVPSYLKPELLEKPANSDMAVDVIIYEGSIESIDEKVHDLDAIVNSTTYTLELDQGYVSKLILKKAGDTIKRECEDTYTNGIKFGDVAFTSAGRMRCKSLFHIALFTWINDGHISTEILKLTLKRCLMAAECKRYKRIAVPALGTGNLRYPTYLVARTMLSAVEEFRKECRPSNLSEVLIVLFPGDKDIIEAFKNVQASMKKAAISREANPSLKNHFPPTCIVQVHRDLGLKIVLAEKEKCNLSCAPEARLILNFSEGRETVKGWQTEDNCYSFKTTSNGSYDSLKEALKKSFEVFVTLKHKVVDVFLMSRELSSAIVGIQKQIEAVIKIAVEKIKNVLSTKSAARSQSQMPVCYIRMVRVFMNEKEFAEMKQVFCEKKPNSDFTSWQLFERGNNSNPDKLYCIEVFGQYKKASNALKQIKSTLMSCNRNEQMPSRGQWYLCYLNSNREEAISPELNDKLNQGADDREQFVIGLLKDKKCIFDFCEMQVLSEQGKLVYGLIYDDTKDARKYSIDDPPPEKKICTDKTDRLLPAVPGKAVRQETEEGKAMMASLENEDEDEEMAIIRSVTCEVSPAYINEAEKMVEGMKGSSQLVVEKKNGKIHFSGSLNEVMKAEKLLKMIEKNVDEKKKQKEEEIPKTVKNEYEMSEDEYAALLHFSTGESWFNQIQTYRWTDGKMIYTTHYNSNDILSCVRAKIHSIRLMSETDIVLTKKLSDDELKSAYSDLQGFESCSCFLSADKSRIIIKGQNYQKAQEWKHKIEVKLGMKKVVNNRRGRVFASNDPDYSEDKKKSDLSKSMSDGRPQSFQFGNSALHRDTSVKKFTTKEGLTVFVYEGDILRLNVDCIVNAANEDLQHGGGVAFFISQAAGYLLTQESNDFVRRCGPLRVGTCCSTTAGNLTNYHCVIHAIGPRWNEYRSSAAKYDCLLDLKKTVISAIEQAAKHNHTSIAIPAISSGIFGVPKEFCAQEYVRATVEYSKASYAKCSVNEVHFVDKDKGMANLVLKAFEDFFYTGSSSGSRGFQRSLSDQSNSSEQASGSTETWHPPSVGEENAKSNKTARQDRILSNQFMFDVSDKIKVIIKQGDISKCTAKVIVCPQDEKLQGYGRIAKAIHASASTVYRDVNASALKNGSLKVGDVFPLRSAEGVHWEYVYHAVAPHWGLNATRDPKLYETQLKTIVHNILKETENCPQLNSIAIPLIGVSVDENIYKTPIPTCCRCIINGIIMYAKGGKNNLQIELWGYDESAVSTFREILNQELQVSVKKTSFSRSMKKKGGTENTTFTNSKYDENKHDKGSWSSSSNLYGKTLKGESVGKDEMCCICMEYIINPKQLPCCGIKFCKKCIDSAFTYKQACPNCNKVFGKLEGNQPKNGTMTTVEYTYTDLPGYKGCGYTKISYFIPSGIQGEEHPNPGKRYEYLSRSAYVPNTEKGRLVVKLLKIAFKQRLVFTIGQSRTTGKNDVVTWNDIHHKTRMDGGQQNFGYPDPTYLDRVLEELAAKGITKKSLEEK